MSVERDTGTGASTIPVLARLAFVQLLYRKRTIFLSLFMLIPVAIALVWALKEENPSPLRDFSQIFFVLHLHILLPLLTLLLSVNLFNSDIKDRTITYLLVRPLPRWTVLVGKFLGLVCAELLVFLPSVLLTFIVFLSIGGAESYWDDLGGFILISIFGVIAYSAFFTLLGIIFKHPLLLGIFVAFFWEKTVSAISTTVGKLTILYYLVSLGRGIIDVDPFADPSSSVSGVTSVIVLLSLIAFFSLLSVAALNRKELD